MHRIIRKSVIHGFRHRFTRYTYKYRNVFGEGGRKAWDLSNTTVKVRLG